MEKINSQFKSSVRLNSKGLISFWIFIIAVVKDILVSVFEIIPERGLANRLINYCFITPIMILGFIFSVQVIIENYKQKVAENKSFVNINFFLALPIPLCFLYVIIMMIIFLFTL